MQKAIRQAVEKPAVTAPYTPAPVSIEPSPIRVTPAPAAAPQEFSTASPLDTSAIKTADPFAELQQQIDQRIAAGKEVEAAIPSEAGQNVSAGEMANRTRVADRAASYLASLGMTTGRIEALRLNNPGMYEQLWREAGAAEGVSRQSKYVPSADTGTRDMILDRLSTLEGQRSGLNIDPALLRRIPGGAAAAARMNPQQLAAAIKLYEAMPPQ
jgi:hypothetical protein